jgi:type VI protein secretion system component Hcp
LRSLIEGPRKNYKLTMDYHPTSDDLWDELVAQGNTKNVVFTWTRAAADYITATLTDCQVISHEIKTPEVGKALIETVEMEPRSVTFTVSDALAGSAYGE